MLIKDTIAAISTPLGPGGIGIIRVSGPAAAVIARKLFLSRSGKPCPFKSHRLYFGFIISCDDQTVVDEGLVTLMRMPHSYTGEDTLEIHGHGGVLVVQKILAETIRAGARLAEPGEFTRRAFLNNRINLAQAEAVAEIISAKTEQGLAFSVSQLKGELANVIDHLRGSVIDIMGLLEVAIDFTEEDAPMFAPAELIVKIDILIGKIEALIHTYQQGRIFTSGINVVIVGRPNVGKSSLMNSLAGRKRAIVTSIPGTTRDLLDETINIHGIPVKIVDTAGIRTAGNIIEQEGIDLVWEELRAADVVLVVLDGNSDLTKDDLEIIEKNRHQQMIILINKSDLPQEIDRERVRSLFPDVACLQLSAKFGAGVEELKQFIHNRVVTRPDETKTASVITNLRHKLALQRSSSFLKQARTSLGLNRSPELTALDLKEAADNLGAITGRIVTDDVLDNIFSRFCLGK